MAQPFPRSHRNFHPRKNQRMVVEAVAEDPVQASLLRKKVVGEDLELPLRLLPPFALPVLRRREEGEGRAWGEQSLGLRAREAIPERHHRKKVVAEGLMLPLRFDPRSQARGWKEIHQRRMEMVWDPLLLRLLVRLWQMHQLRRMRR